MARRDDDLAKPRGEPGVLELKPSRTGNEFLREIGVADIVGTRRITGVITVEDLSPLEREGLIGGDIQSTGSELTPLTES